MSGHNVNTELKTGSKSPTMQWGDTDSILQFLPDTDDTGYIAIGNGTKDTDFKMFLGASTDYVLADVGSKRLQLSDGVALALGTGADVALAWDNANAIAEFLPVTDDTGALHVGDGTTDMDFKVFLGTTADYLLADVGNKRLQASDGVAVTFGTGADVALAWDNANSLLEFLPVTDDTGAVAVGDGTRDMDLKWFGGTATAYALFDVGNVRLQLEDVAFRINTLSSTVGNGYPLSDSATVAFGSYGDDANAAIGSGTMIRGIEGRLLLAYTGGNREQEAVGVLGKLVSKAGTNRHNMCGLMGSYEVNTSLTVGGQVYTTDTWCQAAVIGRVGAGSAITTIDTNGVLAGVAAMSNTTSFATNSGIFPAFYAGRWGGTSLKQWDYGFYAEDVRQAAYYRAAYGTLPASEKHSIDLVATATAVSASSFVGANIATTVTGTAASWVSGLFVNCTQASKAVNGYLCAAELELTSTAANASDNAILVLNSVRNHTGSPPACDPYIMLRDYGTTYGNTFVRIFGDTGQTGTTDATKLWSTVASARTHTHSLRIMVGSTAYYIMCSNTGA